jgi:hypothetical protein
MIRLTEPQWITLFFLDVALLGSFLVWALFELEQVRQKRAHNIGAKQRLKDRATRMIESPFRSDRRR